MFFTADKSAVLHHQNSIFKKQARLDRNNNPHIHLKQYHSHYLDILQQAIIDTNKIINTVIENVCSNAAAYWSTSLISSIG